jgi:hypothetical protein
MVTFMLASDALPNYLVLELTYKVSTLQELAIEDVQF